MSQPQGFVHSDHPSYVCKLNKSLYGLKQAPRARFERFTSHLLTIGFEASKANPSLFYISTSTGPIFLLLYVDDIIISGSNVGFIGDPVNNLKIEFEMTDFGELSLFLGLKITRHSPGIYVHQRKYTTDLLNSTSWYALL